MSSRSAILGIDVGSVSISAAVLTFDKEVLETGYLFHKGDAAGGLEKVLGNFDLSRIVKVAATASTPHSIQADKRYDNRISLIEGARHFTKNIGSILSVGGENFGLIRFDENGHYLSYRSNTSCAAGTGSFLDQQAQRLGLASIEQLSKIAFHNNGQMPKIASRCAVFAKTDLIHAQQEGYTFDEISDGLCFGLARNILYTLLKNEMPANPLLFCGGVSKNKAVVLHLENLLGMNLIVHPMSHMFEAIGAAFQLLNEIDKTGEWEQETQPVSRSKNKFYYPPLKLSLSSYPDFSSLETYEYRPQNSRFNLTVEVDIYEKLEASPSLEVYLGIDIGSTSTKAVLMDSGRRVLAGFYTRTAGRPVEAVCSLFEAIDSAANRKKLKLKILGAGTTGSGRKFVGRLISADKVIDEITTHARAAWELNSEVDTIIEIGGQDAKFTTLKDKMVTFSVMNNVCAAGTGSFIEEQAMKMGCAIDKYASRTENMKAPLSSDRCTVFMERDLNHYLSIGYTVNEVLASVMHSVRENYLQKVAVESRIGDIIFFQGATAKNRSLVAAFEQYLKKPIQVSKYCHLTGALGTALMLSDAGIRESAFRGLHLYKKKIPIQSEVCELCTNHCKLTLANVDNERVAYGFLCGRDYDTQNFVSNNTSGFDLTAARRRAFQLPRTKEHQLKKGSKPVIGIPAGLYLYEALPFWKHFYSSLGFPVVSSAPFRTADKEGKKLSGAEFCAPITAMHGHINYLLNKADYVFVPFYLEKRPKTKDMRRQYCYYSQFMPSLAKTIGGKDRHRILTPMVHYLYTHFHAKIQLYKMLKGLDSSITFFDVASAYEKSIAFEQKALDNLKRVYQKEKSKSKGFHVVLLGRPYTVLSASMNKGIPEIFGALGVRAFFQDMLTYSEEDLVKIAPLLKEVHWKYSADILESAEVIAQTPGVYPVLVTSFKCAPDSFIKNYFQSILESRAKPYLILELDEHDSSGGYETRIEAAVRSFRNDAFSRKKSVTVNHRALNPVKTKQLKDKSIIFPNWDPLVCRLLNANLQREGLNTILMETSETSIRESLRLNSGQCIPLNAIAQGFFESVKKYDLDPARTLLWMVASNTCSLRLYPYHIKTLLSSYGNGMEKACVYTGEISFIDISIRASLNTYFAYMFGGMLRKMVCKTRPYEKEKGRTDMAMKNSIRLFTDAFSGRCSKEEALAKVIAEFQRIEIQKEERPKVAIFGDLYVRDNDVMNQDLIRFIEENGGEVITSPYHNIMKMLAKPYFRKWFREGLYLTLLSSRALMAAMRRRETIYNEYFQKILGRPNVVYDEPPEKILDEYNIRTEHTGESMDNILKVFYIKKHYPDVALFVQASPSFCCPALITEAMAGEIQKNTGVPVVSITYDGTGGNKNDAIIPYLKYAPKKSSLSPSRKPKRVAGP